MAQRLEEIKFAIDEGATEIDIVISRDFVIEGKTIVCHCSSRSFS